MTTSEQGTPEELAETYIEEMGLLLNTGYSDIYTGKQTFTYTNLLEPDTDYTIVVFGYEAGRTTSIESSRFKTLPAGDPTQTTFQFTVNPDRLTARGAEITVTPSDPRRSVLVRDSALRDIHPIRIGERDHQRPI